MSLPKPLANNIVTRSRFEQQHECKELLATQKDHESNSVLESIEFDEVQSFYLDELMPYFVAEIFDIEELNSLMKTAEQIVACFVEFCKRAPSILECVGDDEVVAELDEQSAMEVAELAGSNFLADLYIEIGENIQSPLYVRERMFSFFTEEQNEIYGVIGVVWVVFLLNGLQRSSDAANYAIWGPQVANTQK